MPVDRLRVGADLAHQFPGRGFGSGGLAARVEGEHVEMPVRRGDLAARHRRELLRLLEIGRVGRLLVLPMQLARGSISDDPTLGLAVCS